LRVSLGLWSGPAYQTNKGGNYSVAIGINNLGQITGISATATGASHAFLYSGGSMIDLGTLGGNSSDGFAVDINGQVVGQSQIASGNIHAFLYAGGKMHDLGTVNGNPTSQALNINNKHGWIVGNYYTASDFEYAFLYKGQMHDLTSLLAPNSGWVLQVADSINDSGQICGTGMINGQTHGYLLTPVP